ncbi:MAG: Histidine biosynthesis bifunctional protein HisB [Elusimicrobia bacterium]|nr:Histidine biosynthesis bifunctional protein HisB [Elusimicrobiota bacterium]
MKRPAIFLDRDGVCNRPVIKGRMPFAPKCVAGLKIYSDAPLICKRLKNAGFLLIGVTNQPDVARGMTKKKTVLGINKVVQKALFLSEIVSCFHDNEDNCLCRKPKPGMILKAAKDWRIDLKKSFLIGDRSKDIEAGKRAGVLSIFIDRRYKEPLRVKPDGIVRSLREAEKWVYKKIKKL